MTQKYYFIAIGGVGMSGLAKYLLENGCEVSGSDICDSKYIDKLKELGATVHIGQKAENVPADAIVVASTAIRQDNPEMLRAKELGLTVYHRSDILAEISKWGKFFLGYSGTHGKTTTSGLCSYVLEKAGLKPSYVVGGIIPEIGCNAHSQDGKFFAAELDESDGTIVKYCPNICVVNNLEADHLDFYKDGLQSILETFEKFISNMPESSVVLVNKDCEAAMKLHGHKTITFGLSDADYTAKNIQFCTEFTTFDIYYKEEFLTDLKIILRGKHNVYNALSVLASLHQAGVDVNAVKPHFSTFSGMGRRFQKVGEFGGVTVYDDYAHHPTEIKATLSSAEGMSNKNIIAVFQPHRFTRLKNLWNEFLDAFSGVDRVVVTDVYAASEDKIDGINSENFVKELSEKVNCEYISGSIEEVAAKLYPTLKENDVVIGLGAGTITNLGKELLHLNKEVTGVGR
ncbi:uDP-N-acetylmuramate--L-alanine ligase [Clostridium sp. CAG:729]|nr:uDP-N-acetylmuramate--L-alanine ligase [Clostridium sp. CAG:729]